MSKPCLMTWADVLTIRNGKNQKAVENTNGKYPIYGSGGIMGYADDFICDEGTVVIGRKGSINNPIFVNEKFWNVDTAFGLQADKSVLLPRYLYYFCVNFDFEKLNTTVTIPSLTKSNLLKIKMYIPSLETQQEIAAQLDAAAQHIALRKQKLAQLDALIQSVFYDMFGDPVTNSRGWETATIEAVYEIIDGDRGKNYPKQDEFFDDGYCLFLNAGNVTKSGFDFGNNHFISCKKDSLLRKGKLQRGDIVLTTRGTVGNCAYYDDSVPYEDIRINSGMVILRANTEKVLPSVFQFQFRKELYAKYMSGTAQPQMPISSMKNIPLLVPPLNLQINFTTMFTKIEEQKSLVQQSITEAQTLFDALMAHYFD